jgi:GAF domain-containing protein
VKPIRETQEAVDEFGPFTDDDGDLLEQLLAATDRVRAVVPSCTAATVACLREGLAFTVVATDEEVAALDALQYLDDGPCVACTRGTDPVAFESSDPTDERRWHLFAAGARARGVASTLTLPIMDGDQVTGTVNLYAAEPHAFDGHHEEVAAVFGAWAGGVVTDADLGFESRRAAQDTPRVLRGQMLTARAVGRLMGDRRLDAEQARRLIDEAAARAGVDPSVLAELVLETGLDP